MKFTWLGRPVLAIVCTAVLVGCDNPLATAGTPAVPESELTMVRFAPDAPELVETVVTFWAHRSEDRHGLIRYVDNGYPDGICLNFFVPAGSLLPDQPAMQGDSVQITVTVIDIERFDFHFEPAGLRFDPTNPAMLRAYYSWADPDFNGDGVIDEADAAIEARISFWRQENPGELLQKVPTERDSVARTLRAAIEGFTRYAVASD